MPRSNVSIAGRFNQRSSLVELLGVFLFWGLAAGCTIPEPDVPAETPTTDMPVTEAPMQPEFPPEVVSDRVLTTAAQDLDIPRAELSILRVNQEVWTDSCLGIGLPNDGCLLTLVEGWQLEVVHDDQSWFYRTDAMGDSVRQSYLDNNLPPSIEALVRAKVAIAAEAHAEELALTGAEPRVWSGCLGIEAPGTMCTQVAIFGWRAVVSDGNRSWIYHTDMTGSDIRLNEQATSP